jgi:hypothetical protein
LAKYTFHEIKEKFCRLDNEPELRLFLNDKEYMIIFYKNKCSFQRCGGYNDCSGEYYYNSIDELYVTETVDAILLKRDWDNITDFFCEGYEDL